MNDKLSMLDMMEASETRIFYNLIDYILLLSPKFRQKKIFINFFATCTLTQHGHDN